MTFLKAERGKISKGTILKAADFAKLKPPVIGEEVDIYGETPQNEEPGG